MSEILCEITSKNVEDKDGGLITVYGISYKNKETFVFPDLCTDKRKLEALCDALSKEDVDAKSLPYVIEDFLFSGF